MSATPSWLKNLFGKLKNLPKLPEQYAAGLKSSIKKEVKEEALNAATNAAKMMSGAASIGALAGAVVAPKGELGEGAARGAIGGIIGGVGGFGWGKHVLPAVGGAIVGGAAAGATVKKKERPMMEEGFKFAGVILDYYDDHGDTLKRKFPTPNDLPGVIKTANIQEKEKMPNEAFALIMIDQGHAFRKYACADPGTTAMSVVYFMEHGDKLPEEAQKTAASNLMQACIKHRLMPPAMLTKIAGEVASPITDVTGQALKTVIKQASPRSDDDYAVILPDGSRHYPIHNWNMVKHAEDYFTENRIRMEPEIRREYAVKLAQKAFIIGYPLNHEIIELGARSYNNGGHIKAAMERRKSTITDQRACDALDELFEKRADIHPEVFAECVRRIDVDQGIDKGWDHIVLDPWASTFGVKTAEVVWESGADRVTEEELRNLADNHFENVVEEFTENIADEFKTDPVGIFKSMPDPQKRILARMAADSASYGGTEGGSLHQRTSDQLR